MLLASFCQTNRGAYTFNAVSEAEGVAHRYQSQPLVICLAAGHSPSFGIQLYNCWVYCKYYFCMHMHMYMYLRVHVRFDSHSHTRHNEAYVKGHGSTKARGQEASSQIYLRSRGPWGSRRVRQHTSSTPRDSSRRLSRRLVWEIEGEIFGDFERAWSV